MRPIESYIAQHFTAIYDEVRCGVKGQKREYFESLEKVDGTPFPVSIPHWYLSAKEEDLIDCIAETLHLCLNAGKIDSKFKELEDWTWDLLKIACSGVSHNVINVKTLRVLINSSEQFTSFIFRQLNWDYDAKTDFDGRIRFLREKLMAKNDLTSFCCNLLTAMRAQRNVGSHLAMFYLHRAETLQRLVYQLYDIITVVFIIHHVLGVDFKAKVWKIIGAPDNMKDVSIKVKCDDTEGQVKGFKLYQSRGDKDDSALTPTLTDNTGATFNVKRFGTYSIALVMASGNETEKSERFKVDHGYFNGCEVTVTIPPKQVGKPKVEISTLLLYSQDELPEDLTIVLHEMDKFQGENGQDFIPIAKSLLMASATGTKHDKQVFEAKVSEMKNGMLELAPERMMDYLKAYSSTIHDALTIDYTNQPSAIRLLETINKVYDKLFALMRSEPNQEGRPIIDQLDDRVNQFLSGESCSIGTTATEKQKEDAQELLHLKTLIELGEKYPEIIEAEFGPLWLAKTILELSAHSHNQYITKEVVELREATDLLVQYVKQQVGGEDYRSLAWVCCNRISMSLLNFAEKRVVFCAYGRDLLNYWLGKITLPEPDNHLETLKEDWAKKLNRLCARYPQKDLYTITLDGNNLLEAENLLRRIREIINELVKMMEEFFKGFDEITQREQEKAKQTKGFQGWITKTFHYEVTPPEISYYDNKNDMVKFDTLRFVITHFDAEDLLNLFMTWGGVSYSYSGLVYWDYLGGITGWGLRGAWSDWYDQWNNEVKIKQKELQTVYGEMGELIHAKEIKHERKLAKEFTSDDDVLKKKVEIILKHQKEVINRCCLGKVPAYINDIIKSEIAPYNKIKLLYFVSSPERSKIPYSDNSIMKIFDLISLIDTMIASKIYVHEYSTFGSGKYVSELFNKEAIEQVFQSGVFPIIWKEDYINLLMKDISSPYYRSFLYCVALSLNERFKVIHPHDFFKKLAQYRIDRIDYAHYETLQCAFIILKSVEDYCRQNPEDMEVKNEQVKLIENLKKASDTFLKEHIKIQPPDKEPESKKRKLTLEQQIWSETDDSKKVKLLQQLAAEGNEELIRQELYYSNHHWAEDGIRVPTEADIIPTLQSIHMLIEHYGECPMRINSPELEKILQYMRNLVERYCGIKIHRMMERSNFNTDYIEITLDCYNFIKHGYPWMSES